MLQQCNFVNIYLFANCCVCVCVCCVSVRIYIPVEIHGLRITFWHRPMDVSDFLVSSNMAAWFCAVTVLRAPSRKSSSPQY